MMNKNPKIREIFDLLEAPSLSDLSEQRGDEQRGQMVEDEKGRQVFKRRSSQSTTMTVVPDLTSIAKLAGSDFSKLLNLLFQLDDKKDIITSLNPKFLNEFQFEFACLYDGFFSIDGNVEKWPDDPSWALRTYARARTQPYDFSKEYLLFFLIKFVDNYEGLLKLYKSEIRLDEFGSPDTTSWQRKLNKFLEREVFKDCYFDNANEDWSWKYLNKCLRQKTDAKPSRLYPVDGSYDFIKNVCTFFLETSARAIELRVELGSKSLDGPAPSSKAKGIAFEGSCIAILESRGWLCDSTPKSGDQGADIVANRGPLRFVIQCKDYKGSVGNDSVQQINAAKTFYQAQVAAVVTNSKYTKSAKHLAESTGVLLLFENDLHEI